MATDRPRPRPGLSWGQAGAAVAGVLSLVFVGWEIRQNTAAVRGATYQAVADANVDWLKFLAEHEFDSLLHRWASGDTTLTPTEARRVRSLNLLFWRTVENAHYQHLQGNLPEEVVRRWLPASFDNPVVREWWRESRDRFTPTFAAYVEELVADESPANAGSE